MLVILLLSTYLEGFLCPWVVLVLLGILVASWGEASFMSAELLRIWGYRIAPGEGTWKSSNHMRHQWRGYSCTTGAAHPAAPYSRLGIRQLKAEFKYSSHLSATFLSYIM